jgi:hypothetical protein
VLGLRISIFCFEHTFPWVRYSGLDVNWGFFFSFVFFFFFSFSREIVWSYIIECGVGKLGRGEFGSDFTEFSFLLLRDFIGVGDACFYFLFKKLDEKNVWMHVEPSRW